MESARQSPSLLLGVDGGGTKTSAWITPAANPLRSLHALSSHQQAPDLALNLPVGRGIGGPGNPRSIGFDAACENIETAVADALERYQSQTGLNASKDQLHAACIGLAGAGRMEEQEIIAKRLRDRGLVGLLKVTDDIEPIRWAAQWETALEKPSPFAGDLAPNSRTPMPWVTLIAGTGSIARCEFQDDAGLEQIVRAGGWGYLLGDEGSGYAIGLAALQEACKEVDAGVSPSPLTVSILRRLGFDSVSQIVGWIYQTPVPRKAIADLAPLVIQSRSDNAAAECIVHRAVVGWSAMVTQVAKRTGVADSYRLAVAGGIPNHFPKLIDELAGLLKQSHTAPKSVHLVKNPVIGCLALAHRLVGNP
ncbi:BadF/BadG/BcrA/BcrD ATPase family protein [Pirellula sp. SH-Sr6A]|uniref:BadF/BadG/BcrA/BcrD ATPase family protein n=1 Tax=Pirellula sp. SH-Sr6A TaxID=1632865 RepID=UPI00078C495F|nr:BadF/BadG/BcrA/BcrD ATPase family protein [Pirellula sp. SH-Sr6A]AMV34707.1 BadF/BadG/BcrA/BcrD ATPase family protein [Pirellula sp. SH-Sr6A]